MQTDTVSANEVRVGIDVGSTTVKIVAIDRCNNTLFRTYRRHNADAIGTILSISNAMLQQVGNAGIAVNVTGSVGMGIAEKLNLPFVQEVVAASKVVEQKYHSIRTLIDIGGEDAKIVFFDNGKPRDLRMNGNCAGGTGAFIDQMAALLGVGIEEIGALAGRATKQYVIASRCGVFSKTDIQNLLARNAAPADVASSIFRAVTVQTITTLARGCKIEPPILVCGGPLTKIRELRQAFVDYLNIGEADMLVPDGGEFLPAMGTALSVDSEGCATTSLADFIDSIAALHSSASGYSTSLSPIFDNDEDYGCWLNAKAEFDTPRTELAEGRNDVYIGIDSGSTTTKLVVLNSGGEIVFHHYTANEGSPIAAANKALAELQKHCNERNARLSIKGSCSTGYGEDLIKAAFGLNNGIVETIAHYLAAAHLDKEVSFILDIGGQDMKAIFVDNGIVERVEINEACSSGCGTFIQTFAQSLKFGVGEFCRIACTALHPADLGTRCTIFMNSKVKEALREGAAPADIAAGIAYSVVKNCLYKVLKITDTAQLGGHIVVQGGTMRNDAIVRAFEILTGKTVRRSTLPELMGAYGCALYAMQNPCLCPTTLDAITQNSHFEQKNINCGGCENRCAVTKYIYSNGQQFFSGNRCERIFSNGSRTQYGENIYTIKNSLLFDRADRHIANPKLRIGIPRCLNQYENFPFWHTLFAECGIDVVLSEPSRYERYERNARLIMSDNICFPAKLVHSHIIDLQQKGVDRIFLPFVIFESKNAEQNSYNCPIVTGYSEVIHSTQPDAKVDSPEISFRDTALLKKQCARYLAGLGITERTARRAVDKALAAKQAFENELADANNAILEKARKENRLVILLAGRPYHADRLIQHGVADMIAGMGVDIVSDDIVRTDNSAITDTDFLAQWSFPNRILRAARWCATEDDNVQMVQFTSFGCGPDAFLVDQVRDIVLKHGKPFTLIKLDDIDNVGSVKLRVRSLIESLKLKVAGHRTVTNAAHKPAYTITQADLLKKDIVVPFFTPYISPFIPTLLAREGYHIHTLPISNRQSAECGLRYSNNEVCYPATLIVGDIVKAFIDRRFDPDNSIVAMTQTGGQCRASNYLSLIKKALADAGYAQVPVVALTFGAVDPNQVTFRINWVKTLPAAMKTILYGDCLSKFYSATLPREKEKGQARQLLDAYIAKAQRLIARNSDSGLYPLLAEAALDFNSACNPARQCPKVGVVGEIFLKFNPFAHNNIPQRLAENGIEVVPTMLSDFFIQCFVNHEARLQSDIIKHKFYDPLFRFAYKIVRRELDKVNRIGANFAHFTPFGDIHEEARYAKEVITLNAQFGEGWLLPAEIITYARSGVNNVISLQPFGCIANHIVSRGIENRLKALYPELNILSIDFDSGVSEVNITNRILLFLNNLNNPEQQ